MTCAESFHHAPLPVGRLRGQRHGGAATANRRAFRLPEPKPIGTSDRARDSRLSSAPRRCRRASSRADGKNRAPRSRVRSQRHARAPTRAIKATTEVEPPFLVNADALRGNGTSKLEEGPFQIAGDWDLLLIPPRSTADHLYRGEIPRLPLLPFSYTAYTPCFRSRAGCLRADVRVSSAAPFDQGLS